MVRRILVLAVLAAMALGACGGTNAEPTPMTPGTQDAGTDGITNVSNGNGPVSSSGTEKLFLSADQFDQVIIPLVAGDVLKITYTSEVSISPGLGGTGQQQRGVVLVVLDPLGDQLLTVEVMAMNTVEVAAEISGQHEIVFINPNQLEGLNVNLEYSINP